jgi:hypothetical protein
MPESVIEQRVNTTPFTTSTGCCPPFDPSTMHEREISWHDKLFVKERVHGIWHVPIDMRRKVLHAMSLIDAAHARADRPLMLSEELSPWRSELYIGVAADAPGAEIARISGTFLTRVYEGPYRDARKWCADMADYVKSKDRTLHKLYFGYVLCPSCAKAYGKNYVVLFAQVTPGRPSA